MALLDDEFRERFIKAGGIFTPGAPINEKQLFAGRLQQVGQIVRTISQRGYHAALFGERGVGKTSLSNVLSEFLGGPSRFVLSRTNCDASDNFTTLWRKGLRDVVVSQRKPGLGFTAEDAVTGASVIEMLPDIIAPDDVRRALEQLTSSATFVIIFDEFDRLKDPAITAAMADTIKVLSDYSIDATILIIGVADSVDDLINEHHSVERALVQIPMPRMSDTEISEIVTKGVARLDMTVTEDAIEEITNLSQGLPYIGHLLGLHASQHALENSTTEINDSSVAAGIERSLEQWQQSIKSAYYEATKSPQPGHIYREVLLACALAEVDDLRYFTAASVRKPLRIITGKNYDIPNFARHLKELSESRRGSVIQRVGEHRRVRYRLTSPMLRPYIIMRAFREKLITRRLLEMIVND